LPVVESENGRIAGLIHGIVAEVAEPGKKGFGEDAKVAGPVFFEILERVGNLRIGEYDGVFFELYGFVGI
jgi:hypothetical protein